MMMKFYCVSIKGITKYTTMSKLFQNLKEKSKTEAKSVDTPNTHKHDGSLYWLFVSIPSLA